MPSNKLGQRNFIACHAYTVNILLLGRRFACVLYDCLKRWQLVPFAQHLLELYIILNNADLRVGAFDDIGNRICRVCSVDADTQAPEH